MNSLFRHRSGWHCTVPKPSSAPQVCGGPLFPDRPSDAKADWSWRQTLSGELIPVPEPAPQDAECLIREGWRNPAHDDELWREIFEAYGARA